MKTYFIRTKGLVSDLARGATSSEEEMIYWLGTTLAFLVLSYSGLMLWSSPTWTVSSALECSLLAFVNVLGATRAYFAGGGKSNARLVNEVVCLAFPITVVLATLPWLVLWAGLYSFSDRVASLSMSGGVQFLRNLHAIGSSFYGFTVSLTVIASASWFYIWLARDLRRVQLRKESQSA